MNSINEILADDLIEEKFDFSALDLPPQIHPRTTRKGRQFAHVAKMAGKKYNRTMGIVAGSSPQLRSRNHARLMTAYTSIATGNRHGGPHLHAREIMRNSMTIAERRAFASKVAAQLGVAA